MPKPPIPKADNNMGAIDLYFHRKVYKEKSFRSEEDTTKTQIGIIDFWDSKNLYGKINDRGDFIIPKENLFGFLHTTDGSSRFALNFVADAYNAMVQKMKDDQIVGSAISKESPYADFTVSKSWTSIYNKFHEYAQDIYGVMLQHFHKPVINNKITNFNDFTREFINFFHFMKQNNMPLTLSGFVGGRLCALNTSALMIEISSAKYDNDQIKYSAFVNDPGFKVFRSYATQHGFVIDKNVPWRLVANLNSNYMKDRMMRDHLVYYKSDSEVQQSNQKIAKEIENLKYGGKDVDPAKIENLEKLMMNSLNQRNIFDTYYFRTFELDMKFLKIYLLQMYESFVFDFPTYKAYVKCATSEKKIKVQKKRLVLDDNEKESYNIRDFWIPFYFNIRAAEMDAEFSAAEAKIILQTTKKTYNLYGELRALEFLNSKLKKRHKHIYKS